MDKADQRDIQGTLAGESPAYARLIRRYQADISRQMWRFTRDRRQLEELVQDVFVEAYLGLRSYRGQAPLGHWLARIATRVGYRFWTQRRRSAGQLPLADWDRLAGGGADELSGVEAGDLLEHLLGQLAPRDRLVLTLRYVEGLSVADAADRAGWSEVMVKVQTLRARRKLRKILEATGRWTSKGIDDGK